MSTAVSTTPALGAPNAATNAPKQPAAAPEPPLTLDDVLEEELLALYPDDARWPVQGEHLVNLAAVARTLGAPPRGIDVGALRAALGGPACAALDEILAQPDTARSTELRDLVAARLTALAFDDDGRTGERVFGPAPTLDPLLAHVVSTYPLALRAPAARTLGNRLRIDDLLGDAIAPMRDPAVRRATIVRRQHAKAHRALCLSGGGIRSASFGLGVLQALATDLGPGDATSANGPRLSRFTYLSTVSGGGYIGSWLSALVFRMHDPDRAFRALATRPTSAAGAPLADEAEAAPIHHLREYTNYLSPRVSALSADTWALAATFLRGLLLMWVVLLPLLTALLLVPRFVHVALTAPPTQLGFRTGALVIGALLLVAAAIAVYAVHFVHAHRPRWRSEQGPVPLRRTLTNREFFWRALLPLSTSVVFVLFAWRWLPEIAERDDTRTLVLLALAAALLHTIGWMLVPDEREQRLRFRLGIGAKGDATRFLELCAVLLSGAFVGALGYAAGRALDVLTGFGSDGMLYTTLAYPTLAALLVLASYCYVGVVSRVAGEPALEWSARFSGWVLLATCGWLAACTIALVLPEAAHAYILRHRALFSVSGLASGLAAALIGGSGKTPGTKRAAGAARGSSVVQLLWSAGLAVFATAFAVALLVGLSIVGTSLLAEAARAACRVSASALLCPYPRIVRVGSLGQAAAHASPLVAFGVVAALAGLATAFGFIVDLNKLSLHAMYRMRLVRAYLGASRAANDRRPDLFTGFDEDDNLPMAVLWPDPGDVRDARMLQRPLPLLHVVNMTLNLVHGAQLASQDRKAESFTATALHAGSSAIAAGGERGAYRRVRVHPSADEPMQETPVASMEHATDSGSALPRYAGPRGLTLGTAMAISGAAASPNMGYHSSPAVTFLMTLFNARLGWWLGNPGQAGTRTWTKSCPPTTLHPIIDEMVGATDDAKPYVYLSDGGHFENLGLYEMVLRRCRTIVVSDASADVRCSLEDLGNAMRKITIDTGITIDFDASTFLITARDAPAAAKGKPFALATIRYSAVDPGAEDGTLVYLKASFYGNEPRDVFSYAQASAEFPHESTADQFYSEAQFESYRALGRFIATAARRDPAVAAAL